MNKNDDIVNSLARLFETLVSPYSAEGRTAFVPTMSTDAYEFAEDDEDDMRSLPDQAHGEVVTKTDKNERTEKTGHHAQLANGDSKTHPFGVAEAVTLAAVDANITGLGATEHGLVVAIRAASTLDAPDGYTTAFHVRTGPLHLRLADRGRVLQQMGEEQGSPNFFVKMVGDADHLIPEPKPGAANHGAIFADRFRNHIERLLQYWTLEGLPPGAVLLLDSSLTQRTRDTTPEWWEQFIRVATERTVSLVAVSKKSTLSIYNRPISFWLDDYAAPGYRCLTPLLRAEDPARADRILGNLYAVRFRVGGPALRVDVLSTAGTTDANVLNAVVASCAFRGGMPEPLVRAHALAYIPQAAFRALQADAVVTHRLNPDQHEKLGPAVYNFSAGRYK